MSMKKHRARQQRTKLEQRVLCRDGKPLAVLRPDDPLKSINAAKRAMNTQDWDEIQRLCGPFTFVGWASKDSSTDVLGPDGERCDELQPGDHFTTFDTPEDMEAAVARAEGKST